jgi:hypothetical protein
MSAIIEHAPPPLESLNHAAPEPLHKIVERCMAKNPADRYISTRDLVADLKKLDFTLTVGSAGPITRVKSRRTPAVPLKLAVAVLALAVAIPAAVAGFTAIRNWTIHRFSPEPDLPEQKSLVVLPFRASGGSEQNQIFSDGLTEAVTTRLATAYNNSDAASCSGSRSPKPQSRQRGKCQTSSWSESGSDRKRRAGGLGSAAYIEPR